MDGLFTSLCFEVKIDRGFRSRLITTKKRNKISMHGFLTKNQNTEQNMYNNSESTPGGISSGINCLGINQLSYFLCVLTMINIIETYNG